MEELESQIAKIYLTNNKSSDFYIHVLAEPLASGDEFFMVAELPQTSPTDAEDGERICLAIASALKRCYKRASNDNSFEAAISLINEELGKLATMGEAARIHKLNCILGVRRGRNFSIASCGKVSAYMLRNGEFTDISCSPTQSHPLKIFENYATGKIRLGDLLILSTVQMFNYVAIDRLLEIFSSKDFLTGTRTIIQLLKETAGPEISFGVIFNLLVPFGQTPAQDVDLEDYAIQTSTYKNFLGKSVNYVKTLLAMDKEGRTPKVGLPKLAQNAEEGSGHVNQTKRGKLLNFLPKFSLSGFFPRFFSKFKNFKSQSKDLWDFLKTILQNLLQKIKWHNLRQLNPVKKFFLISLIILAIASTFSIGAALRLKSHRKSHDQLKAELTQIQTLLSNAQGSLLYKNDAQAADFLQQAKDKLPSQDDVDSDNKEFYQTLSTQLTELATQMERIVDAKVTNLGSLGSGENLIKLPAYLANQSGNAIVSYEKKTGKIQDGVLNSSVNIFSAAYALENLAVVYDGSNLYVWDFGSGSVSPAFSVSVPSKENFAGLAWYPVNNRAYLIDKSSGSVISFAAAASGLTKPVVAFRDNDLNQATDLAVDGSIYFLYNGNIKKYQSGRPADFNLPKLQQPISGKGKIYTQKDLVYLYVLDPANKRILILSKKGTLINTLKSPDFTNLKDLQVDEKNKVMYVLNDGSLLKISLP